MQIEDQMGRILHLPRAPTRVISLCPSVTETLFALGAGAQLVGRTRYCCHPQPAVESIASVGGTKALDLETIVRLAPDLIVSVREENEAGQIDALARKWPVLILDPVDVGSAIAGIALLGRAVGMASKGARLSDDVRQAFQALPHLGGIRAVYLIWRKPYMAVGAGTYIDDVMTAIGIENVAARMPGRYPELLPEQLAAQRPQILLAASEPFPFEPKHLPGLAALAPSATPILVDGQMFGWHGARMLQAAIYLARESAGWVKAAQNAQK